MTGIGIRVYSNSRVYYSIIERENDGTLNYLDVSHISIPLSLNLPERLNFLRNTLLDILNQYRISTAFIKIPEFGRSLTKVILERHYLEAIIQESLASSEVKKFIAGTINTLSAKAGFPIKKYNSLVLKETSFEYYPDEKEWNNISDEQRESVLACYASLNLYPMSVTQIKAELYFELRNQIGAGGEAEIFEAFDHQLNAEFAIKRIPRNKFNNLNVFFEESRKLYASRHHNVVQVNYGCSENNFVYLCMPFYKNGSIANIMTKRFLTAREIIRYSLQFLSGLNNIHSKGLIHFDIKPENILLSDSDQALISDFGLAQYTSQYGIAKVGGATRVFAPPEYFRFPAHNLKYDIYQASLSIYRMCNGDKVMADQCDKAATINNIYSATNLESAIKKGEFPDRSFYFAHIPKTLRAVIKKGLSINPDERYDSVIEMMNGISEITTVNDWQFTTDYIDNESWEKSDYKVTARKDNGTWNVLALKNGKRKNDYCKNGLTDGNKKLLLYRCLNLEW